MRAAAAETAKCIPYIPYANAGTHQRARLLTWAKKWDWLLYLLNDSQHFLFFFCMCVCALHILQKNVFWKLERGAPGETSKIAPPFLGQVCVIHTAECRLGHRQLGAVSSTCLLPADPDQNTSVLTVLTDRTGAWVLQPSAWLLASKCTDQPEAGLGSPGASTTNWRDHQLWNLLTPKALNTQMTSGGKLLLCHTGPEGLGSFLTPSASWSN